MSLSAYCRNSALNIQPKEAITPEQMKLYKQVAGIANNLNQITKKMHQDGLGSVVGELVEITNKINESIKL